MTDINAFAWTTKYAPKNVDELIATDDVKNAVRTILDNGVMTDQLLVGPPGIGKTTIAKLLTDSLGAEVLFINASLEGNIDTLRNDMSAFASSQSLIGGKRYIILDEADYLTQATQPALRGFMDLHKNNCGFIFTANYLSKILPPLQSRMNVTVFKVSKQDLPMLVKQFYDRACEILSTEGYEWDKPSLAHFIMKNAPDWRKCLIKLQDYAQSHGKVDAGILGSGSSSLDLLIKYIREKNFEQARKYIGENGIDQTIFEDLFKELPQYLGEESIPPLIILLAKYSFQASFVADQEINAAACIAEIMHECRFA